MSYKMVEVEVPVMRSNSVNRLVTTTEKVVLTKNNIGNFVKLGNRRDIRKAQVSKLLRHLNSGSGFDQPFVVNRINGTRNNDIWRLLDGNHRQDAIEKYLEKFPDRKVEVMVCFYEDLDDDTEKKIYSEWNDVVKQSTNDFIKQYWEDIPITKWIERDFPCQVRHCWGRNTIEFKSLVSTYLVKDNPVYSGGYRGSAIDFVNASKNLTFNDYNIIRAFMMDYIGLFGMPDSKSIMYKQVTFFALFRIWLDNRSVETGVVLKNFRKLIGHPYPLSIASLSGTTTNAVPVRIEYLRIFNNNRLRNIFV